MINEREFEALYNLNISDGSISQRELAKKIGYSLGTVNKTLASLNEKKLITDNRITPLGLEELKPYKVERAILLAAGFGSRLLPITINTPKPLIRVNGIRMIDTIIDSLIEANINEIYIVRGHLKNQFDELLLKYPNVKFVDNPLYNDCNNIVSALACKDLFKNAYVFDADIFINNKTIIREYEYKSYMYGIEIERTDNWCLGVDKKGYIDSIEVGGINVYKEVGISYWTNSDGIKLERDLLEVFDMPGGKQRFWELVPLKYKKENYNVGIKKCNSSDVTLIDTFNELKEIDKAYC